MYNENSLNVIGENSRIYFKMRHLLLLFLMLTLVIAQNCYQRLDHNLWTVQTIIWVTNLTIKPYNKISMWKEEWIEWVSWTDGWMVEEHFGKYSEKASSLSLFSHSILLLFRIVVSFLSPWSSMNIWKGPFCTLMYAQVQIIHYYTLLPLNV